MPKTPKDELIELSWDLLKYAAVFTGVLVTSLVITAITLFSIQLLMVAANVYNKDDYVVPVVIGILMGLVAFIGALLYLGKD